MQRGAEAHVVLLRARPAEARHADGDDVRPELAQALVVETPVAHDPRAEVVDDHVAGGRQALGEIDAARIAHVEDEAPLAAIQIAEEPAAALAEVERHRALDLDHLGAVVGEDARGDRAGDDVGEVEDANAVEDPAGTLPVARASRGLPPGERSGCRPRRASESWRFGPRHERRLRHPKGRPGEAKARSANRREEPSIGELRILEQRFRRPHRGERQAPKLRAFEDLLRRLLRRPAIEHGVDLLPVLAAIVEIVPLFAGELGAEAPFHHPADERRPVAEEAEHHVAVPAAAGAEHARPVDRPAADLDPSLAVPGGAGLLERAGHRFL